MGHKNFLAEVLSFWDKLSPGEQEMLIANTVTRHYRQGENVHGGENDCAGVVVVKSGELRTYILSEDGREITLYRLFSGDICILSASCVINRITFDVHIDAEMDSELVIINNEVFAKLAEENVYAENFVLKEAVGRFSDVMWTIEQILFMSMDKRLARFLLDEAARTKSDSIPLTHEQIARYIGSAREVVSRMLRYFVGEGLVEQYRGGVRIVDKKRLRTMVT
ncbi:MAG: Crp/Fnr family transcriptional regulator [Syntrophomonadaceae bacterium]|nr:Crp/Fnr family transcriptional regulator [Syntrophomonadaceae bacterium]